MVVVIYIFFFYVDDLLLRFDTKNKKFMRKGFDSNNTIFFNH